MLGKMAAQPEQLRRGPQWTSLLGAADRTAAATGQSSDYGFIPAAEAARSAFSELPTELIAAMMVIEIPTTISPYSMAVAPDSLDQKSVSNLSMGNSGLKTHPTITDFFFVLNDASWDGTR
jgi:hypothetical protein